MPTAWWEQIKFGLFFGIGFAISMAVIRLVVTLLGGAHLPQ